MKDERLVEFPMVRLGMYWRSIFVQEDCRQREGQEIDREASPKVPCIIVSRAVVWDSLLLFPYTLERCRNNFESTYALKFRLPDFHQHQKHQTQGEVGI